MRICFILLDYLTPVLVQIHIIIIQQPWMTPLFVIFLGKEFSFLNREIFPKIYVDIALQKLFQDKIDAHLTWLIMFIALFKLVYK